jgi:DNA-directed RNA polymerase specialized sigma24 family protein
MCGPASNHPNETDTPGSSSDSHAARFGNRFSVAVITDEESELIGRTRLEGEPLAQAAARLGITYAACRKRRRRAEHRIVEHYTRTGVVSAQRARRLVAGGPLTLTEPVPGVSAPTSVVA